jgi:hypothetical protein
LNKQCLNGTTPMQMRAEWQSILKKGMDSFEEKKENG